MPDSPESDVAEVVGSAEVEVITSTAPRWGPDDGWTISPSPFLEIGAVDGAQPYLFTSIDSAHRLSDESIAVVDVVSREIRVFDDQGSFVTSMGGQGGGPGEFQRAPDITVMPGDTIKAYDYRADRYTSFTAAGEYVNDQRISREGAFEVLGGVNVFDAFHFPDGSFFYPGAPPLYDLGPEADTMRFQFGRVRSGVMETGRVRLGIVEPSGAAGIILGIHPIFESGSLTNRRNRASVGNRYFPATLWSADERRSLIYVATSGKREVHAYAPTGKLVRIVQQEVPLVPLDQDVYRELRREFANSARTSGFTSAEANALFDQMTVFDSLPPYSDMRVDTNGALWLMRFQEPVTGSERSRDAGIREYEVFDPEGAWLGMVKIPWTLGEITEIGDDYPLTIRSDELGVERVRMYAVEKWGHTSRE